MNTWDMNTENYSLYVFYKRFEGDTLHKILRNCIDPKYKPIEGQVSQISNRLKNSEGPEFHQLSRDREKLDDLLMGVKDFAEKIRQLTQLQDANGKVVGYNPDINDGVILYLASLHELLPWKEPKKYWDELKDGKYDRAYLAIRY